MAGAVEAQQEESEAVEAEQDPLIGEQLGSFRLVRRLGHGGMGAVYLGEQVQIGSKVAVKVLHEHLAVHASLVQRFYSEARAVNLIGHENIVSIFDMNVAPPARYYYIMEYLEGSSLAQFAETPLSDEDCIPILEQVCDGLEAAHENGVVHRDLKPENIFLTRRGRIDRFVKILDFGIAKLFSTEFPTERTRPGILVGTPEYCPPEQASGEEADPRFDLYALGIIAYRLTTGRLPYTGKTIPQVLMAHRDITPTAPEKLSASVSSGLSQLILRAMAKRPEDRFQSAAEFRSALRVVSGRGPRPTASATTSFTVPPLLPLPDIDVDVSLTIPPAVEPMVPSGNATVPPAALTVHARIVKEGKPGERVRCLDASRAGLFLCAEEPFPPVRSRLSLVLEIGEDAIPCDAEIVRHVSASEAGAWNMSAGFAVQFVELSTEQKDSLVRSLAGRAAAPARAPAAPLHDVRLERVLQTWRGRRDDPYSFFSLPADASFADIRQRLRESRKELEPHTQHPLPPEQRARVAEQLKRLELIADRIATPIRRVDYDAATGNYRGVARCIAAGLTVTELENVRKGFLETHAGAETRARIHLATARSWETREQLRPALEEYEKALVVDPINLEAHQRYWAIRRRLDPHAA